MTEVKPWEQLPDDGYWRALLGASPESSPADAVDVPPQEAPGDSRANGQGSTPQHPTPASAPSGWALAEKSYAQGDTLELRVIGYNRGGLLADLGNVRGFVPASQLVSFPRRVQEDERMQELARLVGSTLRLKVIEYDPARNRLVLSERIANPPLSRADQVLATIEPKQTRKGVIRNITDFGAFVDLGGVEGLIHVSEFSWQRIGHPRDVVTPGQEVDVYVIDVNREQKRIACSLKRLVPNPWRQLAEQMQPGDIVEGVVTNVVSFGAFVRVSEAVEGLIHISELAEGSFLHPRDVVQEGQTVQARVIQIDPVRQRLGLSLRKASSGEKKLRRNGDSARLVPPGPVSTLTPTSRPESIYTEAPPPPPPDPGYWESLAQSGS